VLALTGLNSWFDRKKQITAYARMVNPGIEDAPHPDRSVRRIERGFLLTCGCIESARGKPRGSARGIHPTINHARKSK